MSVTQSWFLFAFATPIIWAIVCLIDSCYVGDKVYRSAWDGPVISGLFSIAPLSICLLTAPSVIPTDTAATATATQLASYQKNYAYLVSCLAAVMYFAHVYFYFRALFRLNDVANAEAINALSVVIVPIFAWFLLGERLSGAFYLAISLASIGLIIAGWSTLHRIYANAKLAISSDESSEAETQIAQCIDVTVSLILAVSFYSLSMVLQSKALEDLNFSEVTISFSATTLTLSVFVLAMHGKYRKQITQTIQRFFPIFLCGEGLEILARLSGQRAIEIGPSVTAVALIQSTLPTVIIVLSLLLIGTDRIRQFLSPVLRETLALQSQSIHSKTTLLVITMAALLILQQDGYF